MQSHALASVPLTVVHDKVFKSHCPGGNHDDVAMSASCSEINFSISEIEYRNWRIGYSLGASLSGFSLRQGSRHPLHPHALQATSRELRAEREKGRAEPVGRNVLGLQSCLGVTRNGFLRMDSTRMVLSWSHRKPSGRLLVKGAERERWTLNGRNVVEEGPFYGRLGSTFQHDRVEARPEQAGPPRALQKTASLMPRIPPLGR